MNQENNNKQPSGSLLPILICSLFAGAIAVLVSYFISQFQFPDIYNLAIPAFISVPIALLGAFSYDKGFSNLEKDDYIKSLAGGVGATIGAIIMVFLS